jgi:gluconolactonase
MDSTGDRAVERVEKDGTRTILADHYEGKRLACPNDIVVKSDGAIYFNRWRRRMFAKKRG